jgi:benzoyl-CoA reductase/2-hydroxyglutaryl-CoA dehydratase subunit BcrC/BadD/HgdB
MKKIGITTTVPIEVLLAGGYQPVDLNNIFISDSCPEHLIRIAEKDGFPINCSSWIKGIYGVCLESNIDTVMCVTSGDCSNTEMLMQVLKYKGFKTIPFAYPERPDKYIMQGTLEKLAENLGTTIDSAEYIRKKMVPCRELANRVDELTWKDNRLTGFENIYGWYRLLILISTVTHITRI